MKKVKEDLEFKQCLEKHLARQQEFKEYYEAHRTNYHSLNLLYIIAFLQKYKDDPLDKIPLLKGKTDKSGYLMVDQKGVFFL